MSLSAAGLPPGSLARRRADAISTLTARIAHDMSNGKYLPPSHYEKVWNLQYGRNAQLAIAMPVFKVWKKRRFPQGADDHNLEAEFAADVYEAWRLADRAMTLRNWANE